MGNRWLSEIEIMQGDIYCCLIQGKRSIRREHMSQGEQSRARAEKGGQKEGETASSGAFSPKGRKEDRGCSPDRSEDVLFCFSSALPLPAGSNITLGTEALPSTDHSVCCLQM